MKNDYLWDRTGEDPEIKGFEDLLAVYRHTDSDAPAFPAAANADSNTRRGWGFTMALAFAACLAVSVLIGGWMLLSARVSRPERSEAGHMIPSGVSDVQPDLISKSTETVPSTATEVFKVSRNPSERHTAPTHRRKQAHRITNAAARSNYAALTNEEKYAYGQLLLALSITGDKLQLVKDTIDRIEDIKDRPTDKNR